MPIFNFYKFENKQADDKSSLFAVQEAEEAEESIRKYKTPEECFGRYFATKHTLKLNVLKSRGSGKDKETYYDIYRCDVVVPETEGIILLELENNKSKSTIENKQKVKHPDHPYCRVIIDNNPDHQIIAIEKNSAFDNNPDSAAIVLKHGFQNMLFQEHRVFDIKPLKKSSTEFWPVVWDIRKKFNDRVRHIKLDYKDNDDCKNEQSNADGLMSMISQLAKKGDCDALFELKTKDKQEEINLQELHDDISNIAAVCLKEGRYDLTVQFAHFGCYKYGSDLMAQFGVEDEVIDSFGSSAGQLEIEFENQTPKSKLADWMDKMNDILADYTNEGTLQKGRKRGPRKKTR